MFVLPHHHWVALQVFRIAEVRGVAAVLAQHPAHVAEPEPAARRVGILNVIIDMAVVAAVTQVVQVVEVPQDIM